MDEFYWGNLCRVSFSYITLCEDKSSIDVLELRCIAIGCFLEARSMVVTGSYGRGAVASGNLGPQSKMGSKYSFSKY